MLEHASSSFAAFRLGLLAILTALTASCSSPPTLIEVEVSTTYAVPLELDRVDVSVVVGGAVENNATDMLSANTPEPYRFTIWRQANDAVEAQVVARGYLGTNQVAVSTATARFVPHEMRVLTIELSPSCNMMVCNGGSCVAGRCVANGADGGVGVDGGASVDGGVSVDVGMDAGALADSGLSVDAASMGRDTNVMRRDAGPGPDAFMCAELTADCDGVGSNGCETTLGTVMNCGSCRDRCSAGEMCQPNGSGSMRRCR